LRVYVAQIHVDLSSRFFGVLLEKTEVGAEVGEGIKKNPEQIWPYLFGILFNSFKVPQLAPDTQTLRLLKLIYNTKRSSDKQSESVNVWPKRVVSTRLIT